MLGAPERSAGSWNGIDASFGCDDGEELELGWTEQEARWNRDSGAGDDDVYEPSLGSNNGINQARWSHGDADDREEQCEDEGEPHGDQEPSSEWTPIYGGPCSPVETMLR